MAEIDDVRSQIAEAADRGDMDGVRRLSLRYRNLQAANGTLPTVGRFRAETGREFQLAQRALQFRQAGREEDARNTIRVMARERTVRQHRQRRPGFDALAASLGLNHALFNVGQLVEGFEDTVLGNRNDIRAEDIGIASRDIREASPLSAAAGEVAGIAATLPVAGAVARGAGQVAQRVAPQAAALVAPVQRVPQITQAARQAQIAARGGRAGQIARGTVRGSAEGAAWGGAIAAADAAATGEDPGAAVLENTPVNAAIGIGATAAVHAIAPVLRVIGDRFATNHGLRILAENANVAYDDLVRAAQEYRRSTGKHPTLVQVLGMVDPALAREAGELISRRAPAATVAQHGVDMTRRSAQTQLRDVTARGQPPVSAEAVRREGSAAFTDVMERVGDYPVSIADNEIALLTHPDIKSLFSTGTLREVAPRIAEAQTQRANLSSAQRAYNTAQQAASEAANAYARAREAAANIRSPAARVRAKQQLPALERQARRLAEQAADRAAKVRVAASEVRPLELTIRDLENLRLGASNRARDGSMYHLNALADEIQAIAANAGSPGRVYKAGFDALSASKARAEGVTAGRRVVSSGGQAEAREAASGRGQGSVQSPATQQGAREGVRTEFQERAAQSPRAAARMAEDITNNRQLADGLDEVIGPNEAGKVRRAANVISRGERGVAAIEPRNLRTRGEEMAENLDEVARAALLPRTGGAGTAGFFARLLGRVGFGRKQAEELARDLTDASRFGPAMRVLEARMGKRAANDFMRFLQSRGLRPNTDAAARGASVAAVRDYEEGDARFDQRASQEPVGEEAAPVEAEAEAEPVAQQAPAFLERLAQIESGGDPSARAKTSSAAGLHQFTEGTWLDTLRKHGEEIGLGRVVAQLDDPSRRSVILSLRNDPEISTMVAGALTEANRAHLAEVFGREPSEAELYVAHFMGVNGAIRLINAAENGTENAAEEFPREARANRRMFYRDGSPLSAQEVLDNLEDYWHNG